MARARPQRLHKAQIITARREKVAALRLKGLTQQEITNALAAMGITNQETGKPYSLMSVNCDCKALDKEWRERAAGDTDELRGRQLAEIRQARRAAWQDKDLNAVYRGMELEIKLLGTAAPERSEISGPAGSNLVIKLSWDDPRVTDDND